MLVLNKECETKLVELAQGNADNTCYTPMIQEQLTVDFFYKCSAMLLTAFIKVRALTDLTEAYNIPNKGKPVDVHTEIMDSKTKRPFMIALAHQNRSKPITGIDPTLPPIQYPYYLSNHQNL